MRFKILMKKTILLLLCAAALLVARPAAAGETNQWTFDVSIYGVAAGMSGELGVGPVTADLDVGFDDILSNLDFAFMGSIRVGYGPWAFTTEGLYLGVEGDKNEVTAKMEQWLVEPAFSYRVNKYFEPFAGARYNNLTGELEGPGVLPTPRVASGTRDWWDPIIGANLALPLGKSFSLKLRGDIGGFGIGSDFAWQVYPYLDWRFARWGSAQLGYRWLQMDYETGSGSDRFAYDVLTQGAQIGFTIHF